jgi:serpin B
MNRPLITALALLLPLAACDALGICDDPPDRELTGGESDLQVLADGNDAFAWALYDVVGESGENVFFSPMSISAAFGMVYGGAAGNTATEMEEVLAIGLEAGAWHGIFGVLLADLDTGRSCGPVEVAIGNQVFVKDGFTLHESYQELLSTDYDAPFETFSDHTDAVEQVNAWADKETRGNIPELLQELDPSTVMVLANAIYMKADWSEPFDTAMTTTDPFFLADGSEIQVDTMHGTLPGSWGVVEGGQVISLPYDGDQLSMVIAVPDADVLLSDFEAMFTAGGSLFMTAPLANAELTLSMPKFELRERLDLVPILTVMGMADLFSPSEADLSGMSDAQLYVGAAVHEAWVQVDEEGTEAAAATAVGVDTTSAGPEPVEVVLDRPFLFQVRDEVTGTVLFMGRVADPRGA